MSKKSISVICLALIMAMVPFGALVQCGGGSGSMHDQHMGSSGHQMGSGGHMEQYGSAAPAQPQGPVAPGYAAPAPPVSGSGAPPAGSYGQMGHGGSTSDHRGHMDR